MKEQFIAKVWKSGTGLVINIPRKIVRLFKIKRGDDYRITIESIKKEK